MVKRPDGMNAFEFSVLSALRAAQLHRGCTPRVAESEKVAVTAQHEVAERKVVRSDAAASHTAIPANVVAR
jgi:DNA-directed RNA polymerase subunit K/omega